MKDSTCGNAHASCQWEENGWVCALDSSLQLHVISVNKVNAERKHTWETCKRWGTDMVRNDKVHWPGVLNSGLQEQLWSQKLSVCECVVAICLSGSFMHEGSWKWITGLICSVMVARAWNKMVDGHSHYCQQKQPSHGGAQGVINRLFVGCSFLTVFRCLRAKVGHGFIDCIYWCLKANNISNKIHKVVLV
jgi:hypothetical protein